MVWIFGLQNRFHSFSTSGPCPMRHTPKTAEAFEMPSLQAASPHAALGPLSHLLLLFTVRFNRSFFR